MLFEIWALVFIVVWTLVYFFLSYFIPPLLERFRNEQTVTEIYSKDKCNVTVTFVRKEWDNTADQNAKQLLKVISGDGWRWGHEKL